MGDLARQGTMLMKIACCLTLAAACFAFQPQIAWACDDGSCRTAGAAAPLSLSGFMSGAKAGKTPASARTPNAGASRKGAKLARAFPNDAYSAAVHYLALRPQVLAVRIVDASELNEIDAAADLIRVVNADELNEIDLGSEPVQPVAPAPYRQDMRTAQNNGEPAQDDDLFNRILMTFAGALAVASGMRILVG
jgi:hypothetical protein